MWNWQLKNWPTFIFDPLLYVEVENEFMLLSGKSQAYLSNISKEDLVQFKIEILSLEGIESSKIEGEILDRESLQSSIRRHFGLTPILKKEFDKEFGMSEALMDVYKTFKEPLDHDVLFRWHKFLFKEKKDLDEVGSYRVHNEPMQIVSNKFGSNKVYFEAPPSNRVFKEMEQFIKWFNNYKGLLLVKVAIAHIYFESIHPFEDGNGRVGRLLVEKILSQGLKQPSLISVSKVLEEGKKQYYKELEKCNYSLEIDDWISYFIMKIMEAQKASLKLVNFLVLKAKILSRLTSDLNPRQLKVLFRIFKEGPEGFKGGLSAENYISITNASRATVTRDLQDLVDKGSLIKKGELKYTRYFINPDFI
ncbi:MAG: Fic family protein [Verrucomicrobia bacterium]|nr:Fic family protein [Verrucomicrobiota bacterium]